MARNEPVEEEEAVDFFEIDKFNLDKEWVRQPKLYHTFSTKLAGARRRHEEAKAFLELTEAELNMKIRSSPAVYGISKVTDKAIEAALAVNKKYLAARDAVIKAQYRVDLLNGAVRTLDHRKRALEDLVDLHLNDYFSRPSVKRSDPAKVEEGASRRAKRKATDALNGNRGDDR